MEEEKLVAGGNHTEVDAIDTYSGVVSIETVRILFLIADLYFLEVIAADISDAYLYAKTKVKVYTKIGFGKLSGKLLIIDKAQYGLKSSAARFHNMCAEVLTKLRFQPTLADSDLWFKDCGQHYEYVAVYVDDLIIASKNPMQIIEELKKVGSFELKGVGVPEYYLGGNIDRSVKPDKNGCRTKISAKTYIVNVCEKIERIFDTKLRNHHSPLEGGYHPELDTSTLVSDEDISKYRMLIGSLNWAVTLGRFDVMFAAVTMARYSIVPREGHMKTMLRVFGYLKGHKKGTLKILTSEPKFPEVTMKEQERLKLLYPDGHEKVPLKYPKAKGKPVVTWLEWDADHAHNLGTRRSVTGVLFYVNNTLVRWYCKRQHTVETSTFGSELTALKVAFEITIEMRYKLRMMGVEVRGPTIMFGDNLSVVNIGRAA